MGTPHTHRTAPVTVTKAVADARAMSVTAVLTYPGEDLVGDIVHADGLDFAPHANNPGRLPNNPRGPWVDLEHNGQCVGWARKSLSRPGSPYAVETMNVAHGGGNHLLPVGTTYFDPNDALSSQVFRLVAEDALPGVSLEFRPVPHQFKALGRGKAGNALAYEYHRGDVVRWCHCAQPVNEGATVVKALGAPTATDRLLSALSAKRVGSEPMHPVIYKSLSQYVPQRRLHRVEKAMDPNEPAQTAYDDAAPVEDTPADDAGASPTAMAANNLAQGITDLCEQVRADLSKGEHVKGRKAIGKILDGIESYVEDAVKAAKMVESDLSDKSADDAGDDAEEPAEPEVDAADLEPDEDGTLKCFSPTVKKALKRYTFQQVTKAQPAADDKADKKAERLLRRFERTLKQSGA